jgi:hypothetical protein
MSAYLAIVVGALLLPASGGPPQQLDEAARTMLNMRVTGGALQTWMEMDGDLGLSGMRSVTVESVRSLLDPDIAKLLITRDGWDRPLRVRANGKDSFILISFGADGEPDFNYDEGISIRRAALSPDRDIVWVQGMFVIKPEHPADKAKRAAGELEVIARALHVRFVREDTYPATGVLVPVAELASELESAGGREVPRTDPWGEPYYLWSDGRSYILVSGGSDRALDRAYVDVHDLTTALAGPGPAADDARDIVFANGQPKRWVGAPQ